jgi:hypothetical protein
MTAFPEIGGTMGSLKRTGKNGGNQIERSRFSGLPNGPNGDPKNCHILDLNKKNNPEISCVAGFP